MENKNIESKEESKAKIKKKRKYDKKKYTGISIIRARYS